MKKAKPSRADELRRHREIFEYARAHGLTLKAAELAMLREARAARLARMNRCGRAIAPAAAVALADLPRAPIPDNAPWMMRD